MSIQLSFEQIHGEQPPEASALFLHGILGRGSNLRTLAKNFVQACPDWSACLVDLRGHGQSPKSSADPTIEAAAHDVLDLARTLTPPAKALIGHSFGGKVALEAARLAAPHPLQHVVTIDSAPSRREPRPGTDSVLAVLDALESIPSSFASKSEFMAALIAAGQSRTIAQWLATSVGKAGDRFRYLPDLAEVRALLMDHFARDLWPVVESPPHGCQIHLVIGDQSNAYSPADRERARRAAEKDDRVTVHLLPAGHWVHVDDPEGLLAILVAELQR